MTSQNPSLIRCPVPGSWRCSLRMSPSVSRCASCSLTERSVSSVSLARVAWLGKQNDALLARLARATRTVFAVADPVVCWYAQSIAQLLIGANNRGGADCGRMRHRALRSLCSIKPSALSRREGFLVPLSVAHCWITQRQVPYLRTANAVVHCPEGEPLER
jgi:hypothetical protein